MSCSFTLSIILFNVICICQTISILDYAVQTIDSYLSLISSLIPSWIVTVLRKLKFFL